MSGPGTPRALPSGTVTLVFADVEGSTRLLAALGKRFGPARARLRALVREAAAEHGGAEVDWAGDGVFLAFTSARDAVAAAARVQLALAAEPWPDDEPHRLRVGLHTGEPDLGDEGYVGMDVVVAARICNAAHGEQVVVSQSTRDVIGDEPLPGASFRPLGRHRLKDVPVAQHLFQLVAPGLRADFPPLATLSASSLPALHHRLVGREEALARVERLLDTGTRLVTVTGPGGAGKSRLALEVAAEASIERPVHLVGLAPVAEPGHVPGAIARALGVRETGDEPVLASIARRLNGTGALLYLDNLEHLAPAAIHVAELLDRTPDLQILTTSRMPLRLSSEHVLPLEPLSLEDAATLFTELASSRGVVLQDDALASVHEICRRLDGLPLAIELVAARLVLLPPAQIVRALEEGLALEMEGPIDLPERQRTLRAAIDWSYDRLSDSQRELHGALAVFPGGASLDDARAMTPRTATFLADVEGLVSWSLVRSDVHDGEVRLSMLETVREHALDSLRARGALDALRTAHASRFVALALAAETELTGPDQAAWLDRLEHEYENLSSAFDWLLSSGAVEDALRALSALERFWRAHAHLGDARRWLAAGLARSRDVPDDALADAVRTAALLAAAQSDWATAEVLFGRARDLFRSAGRSRDEVLVLAYLSFVAMRRGDIPRAEGFALEAIGLAEGLGDDRAASGALTTLADVHSAKGEHEQAVARYREAVTLRRRLGDPLLEVDAIYNLGLATFRADDVERSRSELEVALEMARDLTEDSYVASAQLILALVDLGAGDHAGANARAREAYDLYSRLEDDRSRARCVLVLAAASAGSDPERAALLVGHAETLRGADEPDEFEAPVLAGALAILESSLSQPALDAALARGRALGDTVPIDARP